MALVRDFTATGAVPGKVKEAILAKVIADRVKKVLHRVISPEQYGFISGRRLTDGVALVADIIDAAKNGEEDWYLLLVDFQKAFDSVSRDFAFHVLHRMGFPPRMVTWIRGLHAGTTTKMLVNGWLGAGIEVVSEVRQGCPLAPFFFARWSRWCRWWNRSSWVWMSQSGLATNKAKSTVLPLGANLGRDDGGAFKWAKPKDAERLLGVWVTPDGSGLPTGEKALEEIKRRLALWKQKYLTERARGAVANGYIQPVMTFQAQVYPPPASVWKEIEKLLHNFVAGNKATPDKVFLLWSTELLYTPRHEGGLGVHDPNITLSCLAARRVGLIMTEVNQLKELMMRAADLPLKLDTFTAHERLLRHWEGRSQRWKQTCELFMKSPLSTRTVGVTEAEVAKERIVFNWAIMVGVTTPVGGQKDAEKLWDWVLGDLVRRQQDGTAMLKTMAELTEEIGGKGPAKLAQRAFAAAPAEWKEALLTPCSSSADRGLAGATSLPRVSILEGGGAARLERDAAAMDDDFDDGDYYVKPRMRLTSEPFVSPEDQLDPDASVSRPVLLILCGFAAAFLAAGIMTSGFLQFVLIWIALALVIGPLAPITQTGGDCRVGVGPPLEEHGHAEEQPADEPSPASRYKNTVAREPQEAELADLPVQRAADGGAANGGSASTAASEGVDTSEWTREEWDQLKKLLVKLPRGTTQRWEKVAKGVGSGRRAVDDVIRSAKAVALQKPSDRDAYAAFLSQRKQHKGSSAGAGGAGGAVGAEPAPTSRWEEEGIAPGGAAEADGKGGGNAVTTWTEAQDRALLQALKEFPKDTPLRWDRVASAVPGHTKQRCFKRFAELREKFRSKGGDLAD
ncbi:unnamed protein product [Closterium sp. Yama58-4]|nr:unnamed protein product [Closterium sp. Yama58-4]